MTEDLSDATDQPYPKPGDSYVQSFARGLEVIRSFSAKAPQQTLTEVAKESGLTRAGARRILLTLQTLGYVGTDGKLFWLTPRILDLGFAYLSSMPIWSLAEPAMEKMVAEVRESSSAAVLDGGDIIYVIRMPVQKIMRISLGVGSRLPAYCTSLGRVLLADLPDEEILERLAMRPPEALTRRTLTSIDEIVEKIHEVREQGWSLIDQELEEGLVSLSAPIYGKNGRAVAALNISGQANRTSAKKMQANMLPALLEASRDISRLLGFNS